MLDSCLAWLPEDRPRIDEAVAALRAELTKGKHVASVALRGGPVVMNSGSNRKKLSAGQNSIQVSYDDYCFRVDSVVGEVYINNSLARAGDVLSEGCLLTFGPASLGSGRAFAPFRQFTPEVVV